MQQSRAFYEERSSKPLVGHVLAHSHCDAGYKKTVDEYYETEVRTIFGSVLKALRQDRSRKFVWAETIYLAQWLSDDYRTTESQRLQWRNLVKEGRIEIVNGGFVMHDEAISRYDSQIHQMTYGHNTLTRMLRDDVAGPKGNANGFEILHGFQIDPFGPSSFTVILHARAGMKSLILNRIPPHIKEDLKNNQTLEFIWETQSGDSIFVHVLDDHYASPPGFDWEDLVTFSPPVTEANIGERSDAYMSILRQRSDYYRTNHVLLPFGADFRFQNASLQFGNMSLIVDYVNDHPERYDGDKLQYSTVGDYMDALKLNEDGEVTDGKEPRFPVLSASPFLPLWSGYYAQIPALKQMVRGCETVLRALEVRVFQFAQRGLVGDRLGFDNSEIIKEVQAARETVYMMQHHDALPATAYRFVLADYMKRLQQTFLSMSELLSRLLVLDTYTSEDTIAGQCLSSPFSFCEPAKIVGGGPYLHDNILIRGVDNARGIQLEQVVDPKMGRGVGINLMVVNSLSWPTSNVVHFVCSRSDVAIARHDDERSRHPVVSQATPLEDEIDSANLGLFRISFRVSVPPLGAALYSVHVCDRTWSTDEPPESISLLQCAEIARELSMEEMISDGLSSKVLHVEFNPETQDIAALETRSETGVSRRISLTHDIILYDGANDTVYDMRTDVDHSTPSPLLGSKKRDIISGYVGPLFSQVTLRYATWLTVRYKLLNHADEVGDLDSLFELSMLSGPLPPSVNLASRLQTDFTESRWYYDENGFQPVKASYDGDRGVGYSLRPLVSRSWLEETGSRGKETEDHSCPLSFSVHTVDPRGVFSRVPGSMEVMWQRRNNNTMDWWKQGEDTSTVRSSIWLQLSCSTNSSADDANSGMVGLSHRRTSTMLSNDLILMTLDGGAESLLQPDISLHQPLPDELHLMSATVMESHRHKGSNAAETWIDIQVENLSDDTTKSVDLSSLFSGGRVEEAVLCSLTYMHGYANFDANAGLHRAPPEGQSSKTLMCKIDTSKDGSTLLMVGPRQICSVRIPLPILHSNVSSWMGVSSLVLGVVSILCCFFCFQYRRCFTRAHPFSQFRPGHYRLSDAKRYWYSDDHVDKGEEYELPVGNDGFTVD